MVLFNNHDTMRFRDRVENRLLVERFNRTQINDLGGNIFLFELSRDFQRNRNSLRITNDGDIAAFAFHLRFTQWDKQFFIGRLYHTL